MSKFTPEQKQALLNLTRRYAPNLYPIVGRGPADDVTVLSDEEAVLLDDFASRVTTLVIRDFPDHEGKDEDINADAELVVHMIADILSEHRR
jgi:hypothetical protein